MTDNNDDDTIDFERYAEKEIEEFNRDFDKEYKPRSFGIQRDEIGGLEKVLDQLDSFKNGIDHSDMYSFMGVNPPNGFIFVGPPGVGKTYMAKYLAQHIGARFVDLPLNKFESKWVGQSEQKLAEHMRNFRMYHQANNQKVLVFFDEAEEVFKDRQANGWHSPRVNLLLREMDGLGENRGIIFGAATNHLDKCDSAILRAGRLDYIIKIPEYDADMMGDVYRATALGLNRKAPHHDPYVLFPGEHEQLGSRAKRRGLVPADIKEVFRLTAEDKVRGMIEKPPAEMFTAADYMVGFPDLMKTTASYERQSKDNKRRIGFRVD